MNISTIDRQHNFKGNSQSCLSKRTLWFRYLAEINLIFGAWYLYWRIFHSLDFQALWLSIPLLIAEIYSYLGGAMFTIGLWRPLERQTKSLPYLNPPLAVTEWPTVDIFITCYNEPPEMVEQTARAALAIDYPTTKLRVYILDDGNSLEMRTVAQKLCLEDLQSDTLKAEAQRIKSERLKLRERLKQIRELTGDTQAAETFVATLPERNEPNTSAHFLQVFSQVMTLTHGGHQNIRERLIAEEQELIAAIKQKELEFARNYSLSLYRSSQTKRSTALCQSGKY